RKDLEYSFTGEKLTAEHVSAAFRILREEFPALGANTFLTCLPCHLQNGAEPHYKLVLVENLPGKLEMPAADLALRFDQLLQEMNCEYKSKRESGRLRGIGFTRVSLLDFISRV